MMSTYAAVQSMFPIYVGLVLQALQNKGGVTVASMLEMFVIGESLIEPHTSETALHNTCSPSVGRYKAKATKLLAVVHYGI